MFDDVRYSVVSCHVERPLDDRVWRRFSELQDRAPSGFRIAALMRPPDADAGEAVEPWLERARHAAARGPLGHHTHWGGPEQARPRGGDPAARVLREGTWLREMGLEPTVFCGGGWYLDERVAAAVAGLGYADCTGTAFTPRYLDAAAPRLDAREPCWLDLGAGRRLLELPTTHSVGMLAKNTLLWRALDVPIVHVYFHDTDLLDRSRAATLLAGLALLARRRHPIDLARLRLEAQSAQLPTRPFARDP